MISEVYINNSNDLKNTSFWNENIFVAELLLFT